ncbi:MAG: type II secretion system protein [Patescibacteria group bacterium]|nr:type II secretion system protein [Patescibacteria group bacterium]
MPKFAFAIAHRHRQKGFSIIYTALVLFIFSLVLLAVLQFAISELKLVRLSTNREQAFQIAEAGANYYQWHLAHFPTDFWDGNASTTPGPYVHDYVDKDTNQVIGRFALTITPPPVGSTIVTVQSVGYTLAEPNHTRTVTVRYGIASLAQYAFLTNTDLWIGPNESVSGQILSNGGIRFDGTGNAPIQSARQTYNCPAWSGAPCPTVEPGVWGSAPASTQAFWQFPVSNFSFSSITANLANLKSLAQTDGTPAYLSPSNKQGYILNFNANGTVNIYLVKKLLNPPAQAWDVNGTPINKSIDYNSTQLQLLYSNAAIPAHGVFYVEDNVWVYGTVKGRVQVVAAKLPYSASTAPHIFIPDNIVYAAKDNTNVLGLLSQQDIVVTYNAPTNLEIDAAMVAQNGSIEVYDYPNYTNVKNSITVFGSMASYGPWTWTYVDSGGNVVSGYANTYTNYDSNLLYSPPPSFPQSVTGYQVLSWSSN